MCMAEKMNFTFHVRKVDCADICNKLKECYRCIAPEDIIYVWRPSALGHLSWLRARRELQQGSCPCLVGPCAFSPIHLVPVTEPALLILPLLITTSPYSKCLLGTEVMPEIGKVMGGMLKMHAEIRIGQEKASLGANQ